MALGTYNQLWTCSYGQDNWLGILKNVKVFGFLHIAHTPEAQAGRNRKSFGQTLITESLIMGLKDTCKDSVLFNCRHLPPEHPLEKLRSRAPRTNTIQKPQKARLDLSTVIWNFSLATFGFLSYLGSFGKHPVMGCLRRGVCLLPLPIALATPPQSSGKTPRPDPRLSHSCSPASPSKDSTPNTPPQRNK